MVVESRRVRAPGYARCSGSASLRGCWKGEVNGRKVGHDGQGERVGGLFPNSQAAVKRMECGTIREGDFMPKGYGFEK